MREDRDRRTERERESTGQRGRAVEVGCVSGSSGDEEIPRNAGGKAGEERMSQELLPQSPPPRSPQQSQTRQPTVVVFESKANVPTTWGTVELRVYRHCETGKEIVVLVSGDVGSMDMVPVRVHDQCVTSEVFSSLKCDCKLQLELAQQYIGKHGGAIIYLPQEGRGIGLANKIAAYHLQEQGLDTVDANVALGLPVDSREYTAVPPILQDLRVRNVALLTNNPRKIDQLRRLGVNVGSRVPVVPPDTAPESRGYLVTKHKRQGHLYTLDHLVPGHSSEGSKGGAGNGVAGGGHGISSGGGQGQTNGKEGSVKQAGAGDGTAFRQFGQKGGDDEVRVCPSVEEVDASGDKGGWFGGGRRGLVRPCPGCDCGTCDSGSSAGGNRIGNSDSNGNVGVRASVAAIPVTTGGRLEVTSAMVPAIRSSQSSQSPHVPLAPPAASVVLSPDLAEQLGADGMTMITQLASRLAETTGDNSNGNGIAPVVTSSSAVSIDAVEARLGAGAASSESRRRRQHDQPFVSLAYAQSMDARLSLRSAAPLRLSGARSMIMTHALRALHDAIVVGVNTVRSDNPLLNVRLLRPHPCRRHPRVIVLDTNLSTPPDARLLAVDGRPPPLVYAACRRIRDEAFDRRRRALEAAGAVVVQLETDQNWHSGNTSGGDIDASKWNAGVASNGGDGGTGSSNINCSGRVPISTVLAHAKRHHGVFSVMVEGGGQVINALLRGNGFGDGSWDRTDGSMGLGVGGSGVMGGVVGADVNIDFIAVTIAPVYVGQSAEDAPRATFVRESRIEAQQGGGEKKRAVQGQVLRFDADVESFQLEQDVIVYSHQKRITAGGEATTGANSGSRL